MWKCVLNKIHINIKKIYYIIVQYKYTYKIVIQKKIAFDTNWKSEEKMNIKLTYSKGLVVFSGRFMKHLCLNIPAQSCTPTIPKIKNTKKHKRRTLLNMGKVSNSNITRIRIPEIETILLVIYEKSIQLL